MSVCKRSKAVGPNGQGINPDKSCKLKDKKQASQNKVTRIMVMIFCIYYLCYIPIIGYMMVPDDLPQKNDIGYVIYVIFLFNSILNPYVYAWQNLEFRNAFRKLLHIKGAANSILENSSGHKVTKETNL